MSDQPVAPQITVTTTAPAAPAAATWRSRRRTGSDGREQRERDEELGTAVVGRRVERAVVQADALARALDRLGAVAARRAGDAELEGVAGEPHGHLDGRAVGQRVEQLLDD